MTSKQFLSDLERGKKEEKKEEAEVLTIPEDPKIPPADPS